jgi:hypothetical protein
MHTYITKQVKTNTVQDTHQIKVTVNKHHSIGVMKAQRKYGERAIAVLFL